MDLYDRLVSDLRESIIHKIYSVGRARNLAFDEPGLIRQASFFEDAIREIAILGFDAYLGETPSPTPTGHEDPRTCGCSDAPRASPAR